VLRTIKMNVVNTTADYIDFYLRNGYKAERVVFQFRADDGRTVRFEDVPTFTHRGAAQETAVVTDVDRRDARLNAAAETGNVEHYTAVVQSMMDQDSESEEGSHA
jgi:hypothetical protein